jgi:hypothetical protein
MRKTFVSVRAAANTPTETAVHLVDCFVIRAPCSIVTPSTPPAKGGCPARRNDAGITENIATDDARDHVLGIAGIEAPKPDLAVGLPSGRTLKGFF